MLVFSVEVVWQMSLNLIILAEIWNKFVVCMERMVSIRNFSLV